MKTYKKSTVNKLIARFDNELKTLLMNDLKAIKLTKEKLLGNIGLKQDSLTAA